MDAATGVVAAIAQSFRATEKRSSALLSWHLCCFRAQFRDKCHCSTLVRVNSVDPLSEPASVTPHVPVRGVQTTWTYTLASIVFAVVVLDLWVLMIALGEFQRSRSVVAAVLVLSVLLTAAAQVRYCWFLRARDGVLPHLGWTLALLVPAASAWILGPFSETGAVVATIPLWISLSLIACLLPKRPRWALLAGGFALLTLYAVLVGGVTVLEAREGSTLLLVYALLLPLILLSSLWWWGVVVELDQHRHAAAELAVARERLRFAADLHDIQGHHLQVIALKSELAERLLTVDAEAAREHIHEVRLIAKQALEETRGLVAGYRVVALDDEIQNAREVLGAAGARCVLELGPLPAGIDLRLALGMTVREATTNILRHSDAEHVLIRLRSTDAEHTLLIENDGVGVLAGSGSRAAGSGLAGLRERVAAVGGTLESALDTAAGRFTLTVRVPSRVGARA